MRVRVFLVKLFRITMQSKPDNGFSAEQSNGEALKKSQFVLTSFLSKQPRWYRSRPNLCFFAMHCLPLLGQVHDDPQNGPKWSQNKLCRQVLATFTWIKIRDSRQMQRELHTGNTATWRRESKGHLNKRNIQKRREQQISNMIVCVCVVSQPQQLEPMP